MESVESTEDGISPWDLFGIGRDVKVTCRECGASEEDDERHGMGLGFDFSIRSRYGMRGEGPIHDVKCTFTELPEVLVVRLQRFRHDRTPRGKWVLRKEEREVPFGEYLNLGRYTPEGFDEMYRLDGVVGHRGDRPDGGHYIAVVRTADGFDYDTVNDNNAIEHRSDGDIKAMLSPKSRSNRFLPYVLIYSKMQED
ncbi:cysteine ase [Lecanosticta acicola]|uniref:ubiquitinyl hydrolase 1 n=1 Tax=Lecanosticta acicola TaxID=111012 RepID=A0AAI9EEV1_9PEZI|nr:cysteine ase [Lecanosticta acicola]